MQQDIPHLPKKPSSAADTAHLSQQPPSIVLIADDKMIFDTLILNYRIDSPFTFNIHFFGMPKLNTYLNFDGKSEEAFNFYRSVFGGDFLTVQRMSDMPGAEQLPENEKGRIMHISLRVGDEDVLMASDIVPSMGHQLTIGNHAYISVFTETRQEADRLFAGLSAGGEIEMALEDTFWGDYFGSFRDKYGIGWMINYPQHQRS